MVRIDVFIYSNAKRDDLSSVISIFDGHSDILDVKIDVKKCPHPPNENWDRDYTLFIDAISNSRKNSYTVVCKDTSVSTTNQVLDIIEKAIDSSKFDLFYMSKWMDRCDLFTDYFDVGNTGTKIVTTSSPNGIQCLMISPRGKKKFLRAFDPENNPVKEPLGQVLNSRISSQNSNGDDKKCNFKAITCHPNIVHFDVTKRYSDLELVKTSECRDIPKHRKYEDKLSGGIGFFWFIVILTIMLILIWTTYRIWIKGKNFRVPCVPSPI